MKDEQENNKKVGLGDVNFLGLGEEAKDGEDVTIVEDEEAKKTSEENVDTPEEKNDGEDTSKEETTDNEEVVTDEDTKDSEEDDGKDDKNKKEFSVFESTAKDFGLDLEDESFSDVNFDDPDTQDLSKFIENSVKKLSEKKYKDTIEKYPEAEAFIEYSKNGGDPRQYIETMHPQFDYNEVDFDEQVAENEQNQEQIVRNHLAAQGNSKEEINEMVEDFRNGGILAKQAKRSLGKLQQMQEQAKEDLIEQQKEQKEQREQSAQKEQNEIKSIIDDSESIKGMKLPKTDKDDLKNYLFDPIDEEGRSKAFIDGTQMSNEERIAIAYLKMKDFDFTTLIENEAETRNAKKLKDTIKKSKDEKVSGSKRERSKSGNVQDIKPII